MQNITIEQLNDFKFFKELQQQLNELEFFNDVNESYEIYIKLIKSLPKTGKGLPVALADGYESILTKLRFLLLSNQSEKTLVSLFEKKLVLSIRMDYYDLLEELKLRLSDIPIDDRDKSKKKLATALLDNNEVLTTNDSARTVSDWVKYYNNKLGTGAISNINQSNFFSNDERVKKLNKVEILWLKELFAVYEYLKRSSATLEGNEDFEFVVDEERGEYILNGGEILDLRSKDRTIIGKPLGVPKTLSEREVERLEVLSSTYDEGSIEKRALSEEAEKERNLDKLRYMATKFSEGSLERRALEEEIKKVENL